MLEQQKFPLLLARIVDLLRRDPGAVDDYKAALRGLVELSGQRSITLRLRDGNLFLEGAAVPADVPFLSVLLTQMGRHGVSEIQVSHRASALDLMYLASALATEQYALGDGVEEQLRQKSTTSVSVVTVTNQATAEARRAARVSDVLQHVGIGKPGAPSRPVDPNSSGIIHGLQGAVFAQLQEDARASATPLAGVLQKLRQEPAGPGVPQALAAVAAAVERRVQSGRIEDAVEAIVTVIREEGNVTDERVRGEYSSGLRRLFTAENLKALASLLLDPLYSRDVMVIMIRAGTAGTQQLLELLIKAPTIAERRALLEALRGIKHGTEIVVGMLNHPQWFVARNVADLVGELRIEEGVEPLGQLLDHTDPRVRRSAAIALARIGTSATGRYLRKAVKDSDGQIRLDVAKSIGGKGLAGLVMPLASVAETESELDIKAELFRALGRIGTPEAVVALKKGAEPGGRLMGRRPTGPRLAAVEGLGMVGGEIARAALHELAEDSDKEVRMAARKALDATPAKV
jgi:hypothetical protein